MNKLLLSLVLPSFLFATTAVANDADTRQLVALPAMMQQHMLGNMRDHLLALTEIQEALAAGGFDRAADIAEHRIGMSSLASHNASHMAPYMPRDMQDIGTQMHRAASQFAVAAQEAAVDGNMGRTLEGLSKITRQCVACHAGYRIR